MVLIPASDLFQFLMLPNCMQHIKTDYLLSEAAGLSLS